MRNSHRPTSVVVKKQPISQEPQQQIPKANHFHFPPLQYLKSSHTSDPYDGLTDDFISEVDDSDFEDPQIKTNRRKTKTSKTYSQKKPLQVDSRKVKKEHIKTQKTPDPITDQDEVFELIDQAPSFTFKNTELIASISKKPQKNNKKSKKHVKIEAKKQEQEVKSEVKEEKIKEEYANLNEWEKVDFEVSKKEYEIVDFGYNEGKKDFRVDEDLHFVVRKKLTKNLNREKDGEEELVLAGKYVCYNRQLFWKMIQFYRGLSKSEGLTS